VKLKVVSDGTAYNTRVENADTGELLEGVSAIFWSVSVGGDRVAQLGITVLQVPVELVGEAEVKKFTPLEAACQT